MAPWFELLNPSLFTARVSCYVGRGVNRYVGADLEEEWSGFAGAGTAGFAGPPLDCAADAGGTGCEGPFGLTYRGFGYAAEAFGGETSLMHSGGSGGGGTGSNRAVGGSNGGGGDGGGGGGGGGGPGAGRGSGAHTSLSLATLAHVQLVVERVLARGVPGDLIEAGVSHPSILRVEGQVACLRACSWIVRTHASKFAPDPRCPRLFLSVDSSSKTLLFLFSLLLLLLLLLTAVAAAYSCCCCCCCVDCAR